MYALDNTVACRWMDDLSKHRNLMQAERPDQAVKLDCLDIPIGQKLIVLDDSLSDITLVLYEALGMRAELWIDDRYIAH